MRKDKKIFLILIIMFSSLIFCSYSKNKITKVKGTIQVYGNNPFTYIGIVTTDNKEYAISAEEKVNSELWKTQGRMIEITGYIIKPESDSKSHGLLKDGKIEVTEWKYVK